MEHKNIDELSNFKLLLNSREIWDKGKKREKTKPTPHPDTPSP